MKSSALIFLSLAAAAPLCAEVRLASPFGDHMVLQQGRPVPVWGTASSGEEVTVEFANQRKTARADANGEWRLSLDPLEASAISRDFVVSSAQQKSQLEAEKLTDVLVGEVWLCGGQSNMERQLGPRPPQPLILNWEAEAAAAKHPLIRELYVKQSRSAAPQTAVTATWTVCSPETVRDFTAVGYFFARDLHVARGVPVGIIHSSWGGTPAEAWTSREGLKDFPEFSETLSALQRQTENAAEAQLVYAGKLGRWYASNDPGSGERPWHATDLDTTGWETMNLPAAWEEAGHPGFDGIVWFRRTFDIPADWAGRDLELRLGAIDDVDTTWVNGKEVGSTTGWATPRVYRVSASALRATGNAIAVRVLDKTGNGGIWNPQTPLSIAPAAGPGTPLSLNGPWSVCFATALTRANQPPSDGSQSPSTATVLYNAMIAPLVPYAMRGVAFYQGEANASRATQYRTLFPALITDWRKRWGQGDFPFLFVQIAPFQGQPPEIREAQLIAWQNTSNTAMVVTIDVGDAKDIHPANKGPVGARLALAARALAYGETLEYSGPVFEKLSVADGRAVLHFTHLGGGLVSRDGTLDGFTVAGADGVFHPATAEIVGDAVVVSCPAVTAPAAVRYGWANVASGNLFNRAGLPASPFRTDLE